MNSTGFKKAMAVVALAAVMLFAACDGPWPQSVSGDDGWPLSGIAAACASSGYTIYAVHRDNALWEYTLTDPELGSELVGAAKVMAGVKSVYWAASSWRILAHKPDGSLAYFFR